MPVPPTRSCRLLAGLVAVLVPLAASRAAAAPVRENIRLLEEARRACVSGDHARGTEILTRLLAKTGHPSYLHNQARCDEQNGRDAEAAQHYRDFLREASQLPRAERAQLKLLRERIEEIETRIVALEASAAAAKTASLGESTPAGAVATAPPLPAAAPADAGLAATVTTPAPAVSSPRRSPLAVAGLAAVAGGGASLVAGVVAGLMARNAEADLQNAREGSPFDVDRYRTGQRAATVATVAFVAAPILIGVGAGLLWRAHANGSEGQGAAGAQAGWLLLPLVAGTSNAPTLGGALSGSY